MDMFIYTYVYANLRRLPGGIGEGPHERLHRRICVKSCGGGITLDHFDEISFEGISIRDYSLHIVASPEPEPWGGSDRAGRENSPQGPQGGPFSEKLRIAFLLKMFPTTLQERAMEDLDRLATDRKVHDKVVSLAQSSSKDSPSDAMDCSGVDEYDEDGYDDLDINAISKNHCARCDGNGHYARDCTTPAGKGKVGGKVEVLTKSRGRLSICQGQCGLHTLQTSRS